MKRKNHLFDTVLVLVIFGIIALANAMAQSSADEGWKAYLAEWNRPAFAMAEQE